MHTQHPVRFIQTEPYYVAYTVTHMQIGCEWHSLDDWWSFDDDRIAKMDDEHDTVAWWKTAKPALKLFIETWPATPVAERTEDAA